MEKNLPSIQYLIERKIAHELRPFPEATKKGAANVANALGYKERQMVKTLIFESDTKEAVLIMVGGDQSAVSSHLKKVIGSRNISMCPPAKVKSITGYEIGSIPPFHWQPHRFRSFLDASLMQETVLGVGTGSWGLEILITPEHLVQASKALIVNLTDREKPVM